MIKYPLNVTIDTNVFEANQYDFGADSTMCRMRQSSVVDAE